MQYQFVHDLIIGFMFFCSVLALFASRDNNDELKKNLDFFKSGRKIQLNDFTLHVKHDSLSAFIPPPLPKVRRRRRKKAVGKGKEALFRETKNDLENLSKTAEKIVADREALTKTKATQHAVQNLRP